MPIEDLEQRLARLDNDFKQAPSGDSFELPAPGMYQAKLYEIDTFEQKKPPGHAFLKIVLDIQLDPDYEGRKVDLVYNIEDPDRFKFLKRDLKTLGVDVDSDDFTIMSIMPGSQMWDDLLDSPVRITIKNSKKINEETGKPYRNVFLDERLGGPVRSDIPSTVEPAPAAKSDDDIPF